MAPSLVALAGRAGGTLRRRKSRQNADVLSQGPQAEPVIGEIPSEGEDAVDDGAGAIEAGVEHNNVSEGDGVTVTQPTREGLWKGIGGFHKPEALLGLAEKVARPAARLVNRNQPDSLTYAMTVAVNALGVKEVSEVTGLSKSAIYAGCDAGDSARSFPALPFEAVVRLSLLMNRRGARGEVFALPFLLKAAQDRAPAAHSANILHQASHVTALYGRTAAALCRLFDRAEASHKPVPLDPRERDEAVAAIDATIEGLTALRTQLLTTTSLPSLYRPPHTGSV